MSSNPLVPESTKLLGNKTEHSTELNELLSEDKTEKSPLCHFCMKDNKESFTCKECHNVFCLDCFKEISKKKDSTKEFVPLSEEEKQKWVCFICEGTCTCKACTLMKNEKAEKKCILCKATTNLIKIDEMIQKTSTTFAPWHILESVDKKYARIKALEIVVDELEKALKEKEKK